MVPLLFALFYLLTLVAVSSLYWYLSIPKNLPPGPIGIPLFGSYFRYRNPRTQHLKLQKDVEKYGSVFKLYMADKLVVILGNYEAIQEALVKQGDIFAGRPQVLFARNQERRHYGLIFSEGDLWKEQRRFALSTLRDLGIGRPIMEPRIQIEAEQLIEAMKVYANSKLPFDPHALVTCAVSNVINQLVFGRRFDYDDDDFVHQVLGMSRGSSSGDATFLSPPLLSKKVSSLLQFIGQPPINNGGHRNFAKFVEREMKTTMSVYDPNSEPNNYIHAFLKATPQEKFSISFTETQLLSSCFDLFSAGMDTTSTTIRWCILFLTTHPEIQERLYQEIKEKIGTSALPSYADRTKLPFADAVIMETQRLANLVPMGVMRRTLGPTTLLGYDIPEDAVVVALLTNVMHNPETYPDPLSFKPDRFLDKNGKAIKNPKLTPFQAGKRICLGESLARMELFLFITGLFSRFRFYFPKDRPRPTLEPSVGFTSSPMEYDIIAEVRND